MRQGKKCHTDDMGHGRIMVEAKINKGSEKLEW